MKMNPTKQKVVDAASFLFYQKGFHGTSVRDIAERASVNVSLISYYFKGKQGLLEYAVTNYYEKYLKLLEEELEENSYLNTLDQFKNIIYTIIAYKTENFQLTSFIHRELSLDSTFVREMTVTYLAKENHILSTLFFSIIGEDNKRYKSFFLMQLKGMIMSPFVLKHEWTNQMLDEEAFNHFVHHYTKTIHNWLQYFAKNEQSHPIN